MASNHNSSTASSAAVTISGKLLPPPQPQQQLQQQHWRPPPQETALPLHVQSLERALDMSGFINQLEKLLTTSLETAASVAFAEFGASDKNPQTASVTQKSLLTTKGIWEDDQSRKRDLGCLYNFGTLGKRKWLKNVLLEDSDSDSETEQVITERDLKILLKIHKYRRKYQKRYHTDILNSQYTYFGAGLLAEHDRFPDHQQFILGEYGFTIPAPPPPVAPVAATAVLPVSSPKRSPVKRRRNSQRLGSLTAESQKPLASISSMATIGSEPHSTGNGQQSSHPSSSSDFNSPTSSPSSYPSFAVPLSKTPSVSSTSAVLIDSRSTASVSTTIASLARPIPEPAGGESSADAMRWRMWRAIVAEDIPKAYTERIIQRKYQSVVLRQIALYCAQFLEQSRETTMSGKQKSGNRHGKKHGGQIMCLRPVSKQQQQPPPGSGSTSK